MITCLSFKHHIPDDTIVIDCTSNSDSDMGRALSPFNVGPIETYDGDFAYNIENLYQFSKVYFCHNNDGEPTDAWNEWRINGWHTRKPIKHPFGAWNHCLYWMWDGKKMDRLQAQKEIFISNYSKAIVKTPAFQELKKLYNTTDTNIILIDYEGFDHRLLNMSWDDVVNHKDWPIGQAFVCAMLLEGHIQP